MNEPIGGHMKDNLLNGLSEDAREGLKEWAGVATNLPGDRDYLLDKTSVERIECFKESLDNMDNERLLEFRNFFEAATQLMQEHVIALNQVIENRHSGIAPLGGG